jgi:hypothetical protein
MLFGRAGATGSALALRFGEESTRGTQRGAHDTLLSIYDDDIFDDLIHYFELVELRDSNL